MKTVILAGGLGTRLAEQTEVRPKPMVEIGGRPILWHLMKYYSSFGIDDFIICLGYRGYMIKEYFANYFLHMSDVTFDMAENRMIIHEQNVEPWRVTLVDTGEETQTGGRIRRIAEHVAGEDAFCMTYGDGLSDVDLTAAIAFHHEQGRLATVTAVHPPGRYGTITQADGDPSRVTRFEEKPPGDGNLINGGFFVLDPAVIDRIADDAAIWEREPLQGLAADGQLSAYVHEGFWQPMDTLRERNLLEDLWRSGDCPWKRW